MLSIAGVEIKDSTKKAEYAGIPFDVSAKILLQPGFALSLQDLRERFTGKTSISADSVIVLGAGAASQPIENMTLDGCLRANAPVQFFSHFKSERILFEPTTETDSEVLRIRGYKPITKEEE